MSFATRPPRPPARFRLPPAPAGLAVRAVLFGVLAIAGAAWALVRHYTLEPPPMRVPVAPRTAPTYDADAGELPVPEVLLGDGG